jgi:hypothetical protein
MSAALGQGKTLVYRPGKRKKMQAAKTRRVTIAPLKVMARSITMGFDKTEAARKKRKSLDGKPLK